MESGFYEVHCQLRVKDEKALWNSALIRALTYKDVTAVTACEIIGPSDDADIVGCLLLMWQISIPGCRPLTLSCNAIA